MLKDKRLRKLFKELTLKHDLSDQQVEDIHNSWGLFIRRSIASKDFSSISSEEEFNKLKTNYVIPWIGKLYTTYKCLTYTQTQSKIKEDNYGGKEED